jgi:hypothetical protein
MKRIADRVYKVGRRSDEAESRSGYPGRLGTGTVGYNTAPTETR